MEEVQSRSTLSILLFGLILGPFVLMLWLGRGWLAVVYFFAQLIFVGLLFVAIGAGFVTPPVSFDSDLAMILLNLPLNVIGKFTDS